MSHLTALPGGRMRHPSVVLPVATPKPVLYDRDDDPDKIVVPLLISAALSILVRHAKVPGSVERIPLVEAADVVEGHFLPRPDWCDPHGITRPPA